MPNVAPRKTESARLTAVAGGEKDVPAKPAPPLNANVEVELIMLFSAVAETLSFTKAAQRLGIDQSWLSHKIRQFESSLGLKLFLRNTRNVELTEAGHALLGPAQRLAEVASQARGAADLLRNEMTGALRIGALPFSFPDSQRTALLDRFLLEHPDKQILVVNGPTPVLIENVRAGRVDMAFVSAPFDERGLDLLLLRENRYCMFMPQNHPLAGETVITTDMLKGQRAIIPSPYFSPDAYELYYRPVLDAGIVPVAVPEFQGSVKYATEWELPVICTQYAAERSTAPGWIKRPLDFVPPCKKYLVRLAAHRTDAQLLLWDMAEVSIGA